MYRIKIGIQKSSIVLLGHRASFWRKRCDYRQEDVIHRPKITVPCKKSYKSRVEYRQAGRARTESGRKDGMQELVFKPIVGKVYDNYLNSERELECAQMM